MIQRARTNARSAGIGELITFEVKDVAQLTNPLPKGPYGTVLSNPPYGERLDSEPALIRCIACWVGLVKTSLVAGISLV
ncbi:hypothetical protein ACNKHT_06360 [Shigella flexneri]